MALSAVQVANIPRVGRKLRKPVHTFQIRQRPFQIQPFLIAPVLPGDTMQSLLLQVRAVSDPIKNPIVGWWAEYYFFYVPHRSLSGSASYQAMMLDPGLTAGNTAAASVPLYRYGSGTDYVGQCLTAVVDEFFRDEGESATSPTINSVVAAQLTQTTWMDSVQNEDVFEASTEVQDFDVDSADANTTIQASEVDAAMRKYEQLRAMRLTDMTYEDYLRTYGVKVPDKEVEILPEIIRYVRSWQYPSNTVNSSTGTPVSAVSWAIAERADKKRFFREPGFIFGVAVFRPKMYMSKQTGNAASMLDNAFAWLPAVLADDAYGSIKEFAAAAGPLPTNTDGYYVDVKDLYLYGDQFINFALTETNANLAAVPTAALVKKYPADADVTALFNGAAYDIRHDGIVSLQILSRLTDTTSKT
jgi:hypothetical protein